MYRSITEFPHKDERPPTETVRSLILGINRRPAASPLTQNLNWVYGHFVLFAVVCQYEHTFCFTHPWCWCLIDYQCATELDFSWGLIVWLLLSKVKNIDPITQIHFNGEWRVKTMKVNPAAADPKEM